MYIVISRAMTRKIRQGDIAKKPIDKMELVLRTIQLTQEIAGKEEQRNKK